MSRPILTLVLSVALSAAAAHAAPPSRPLPLTPSQYAALCEIEQQPAHAAVRLVHATYLSEHEQRMEQNRMVNDATTLATFGTYIGLIATFLIVGL